MHQIFTSPVLDVKNVEKCKKLIIFCSAILV